MQVDEKERPSKFKSVSKQEKKPIQALVSHLLLIRVSK
jgi:hypothetical protein